MRPRSLAPPKKDQNPSALSRKPRGCARTSRAVRAREAGPVWSPQRGENIIIQHCFSHQKPPHAPNTRGDRACVPLSRRRSRRGRRRRLRALRGNAPRRQVLSKHRGAQRRLFHAHNRPLTVLFAFRRRCLFRWGDGGARRAIAAGAADENHNGRQQQKGRGPDQRVGVIHNVLRKR